MTTGLASSEASLSGLPMETGSPLFMFVYSFSFFSFFCRDSNRVELGLIQMASLKLNCLVSDIFSKYGHIPGTFGFGSCSLQWSQLLLS